MLPMIMKINFNAEQCRLNDNCLNVWVWHTICINEKLNQIRVIGESIGLFCLHKELGMIKLSWQTVPSDSRLTFSRKTSLFGRGFVMPNLDRTRSLSLNVRRWKDKEGQKQRFESGKQRLFKRGINGWKREKIGTI